MQLDRMTLDEIREEFDRLKRKSRAHRKSLKDQQRAILDKNAQIANLEKALATLLPSTEKAEITGYLDRNDRPHEDTTADLTTPVVYKVT